MMSRDYFKENYIDLFIQILTADVKQTHIIIDYIYNSSKTLFLKGHMRKPIDVHITQLWVWSTDLVILILLSSFFGKFLWSL